MYKRQVDGSISDTMAAFISYPQDKTDHTFSVYVNRPGLSFGYFFQMCIRDSKEPSHGKIPVKKLVGQGEGAKSIEVTDCLLYTSRCV